jgi:hypothetical protein
MEEVDYSSDLEEKMLDYVHIDYSQFLKPKHKATILVGKNYQATVPEINEKKIQRQTRELERYKKETENEDKIKKKESNSKSKDKINLENGCKNTTQYKKRKIEEK